MVILLELAEVINRTISDNNGLWCYCPLIRWEVFQGVVEK